MDGAFHWATWRYADRFCALLLPRLDHNIGTQEMMAVMLGVYTWLGDLRDAVLTVYVDNEGVRYSMISGTSRPPEVALSVVRLWHLVADVRVGLLFAGSKSGVQGQPGGWAHKGGPEIHDLPQC